jgi:hypothetical protein
VKNVSFLQTGLFDQTKRGLMKQGDSRFSDLNHPVCYVGLEKPTSLHLRHLGWSEQRQRLPY